MILDCRAKAKEASAAELEALMGGHPATAPASVLRNAVVKLCDRHYGVGADGVLVIAPARGGEADLRMRVINGDGTEPERYGVVCRAVHIQIHIIHTHIHITHTHI